MPKKQTSLRLREETIEGLKELEALLKRRSQADVIDVLVAERLERERAEQVAARLDAIEQRLSQLEEADA